MVVPRRLCPSGVSVKDDRKEQSDGIAYRYGDCRRSRHCAFASPRGINKPTLFKSGFIYGSPTENRTPDSALRGRRLNRLTMRPRRRFGFWLATTLCVIASLYAELLLFPKNLATQSFSGALFFIVPPFSPKQSGDCFLTLRAAPPLRKKSLLCKSFLRFYFFVSATKDILP